MKKLIALTILLIAGSFVWFAVTDMTAVLLDIPILVGLSVLFINLETRPA